MKKAILLLSLSGLVSFSFAQSAKFGIKAGLNFSSISVAYSGGNANSSTKTGFNVGGLAEFSVANFTIQPGIFFTTKGGSSTTFNGQSSSTTFDYIEVPVNLLYNVPIPSAGKVFFGAGPYIAHGVGGTSGVTFGGGNNDVGDPDFGLNFLGGFRLKSGLELSVGYGLDLKNLNNDNSSTGGGFTVHNKVTSISIGYFFL